MISLTVVSSRYGRIGAKNWSSVVHADHEQALREHAVVAAGLHRGDEVLLGAREIARHRRGIALRLQALGRRLALDDVEVLLRFLLRRRGATSDHDSQRERERA
jgi:hypothetical protein